jgi:hypothetical protein
MPLTLSKYSLGVGDRFAHQAEAQLQACISAASHGVEVIPVWNKSNREHKIIGSRPESVRQAADAATTRLNWTRPYHVDADHINHDTVGAYINSSDFYTIDVADWIGRPAAPAAVDSFFQRHPELAGDETFPLTGDELRATAATYLAAVTEAGRIYRRIESEKGTGNFITEVSMDETGRPQTPAELLVILAAIADEKIPIQTIAPKFTGRFNKGVDYVGDPDQFAREFRGDIAAIAFAIHRYGLPASLKLSVHSGSDKFSIYAPIRQALRDTGAGVHLKTAGTTWLEELIGLAEAGGEGLALAKSVYRDAHAHQQELCAPYAAVIDIDPAALPDPGEVDAWTADQYAATLRHDQTNPLFHPGVRQLLHVGYKVAAKMGDQYLGLLKACKSEIARNVTGNLYDRHIRPLFLDT